MNFARGHFKISATIPEVVILVLFGFWLLIFLCCGAILVYGIFAAILAAWRQWLEVCLWAAISLSALALLAFVFFRICRTVEYLCRPKNESDGAIDKRPSLIFKCRTCGKTQKRIWPQPEQNLCNYCGGIMDEVNKQ